MQFPQIDPVFFRLGPLAFRWYGLMYIIGFLSAYFIIQAGVRRKGLPLTKDDVSDLVFMAALGVILGGRTGYVLFYNLADYLAHPLKVFAVWEGGMSFHGGLLGAILGGAWFARKKNLNFLQVLDIGVMTVPIGLGLGRIGNFINGELYGRVTTVPWGVIFPDIHAGGLPRHPSQLYEAFLEGPLMYLCLWGICRLKPPAGTVFWSFIGFYGLFRFTVEFFREPDYQLGFIFGSLSMGQLLSLPMFLVGGGMVWWTVQRGKRL